MDSIIYMKILLKWNSLDNSLIFNSLEYLDYNYIKKFNYNWIFRNSTYT